MNSFRDKSKRTAQYEAAVRTLRQLVEAEGESAASDACAEATAEKRREDYQRAGGLKQSEGQVCVQRLLGNQCHRYSHPYREGDCECDPPGADHQTLWLKDGQPFVYLSQPYPLGLETLRKTVRFCDRFDLDMVISTWPSWHYPGNVLSVEFTRRGNEVEKVPPRSRAGHRWEQE